jgi:hypothetical protein
MLARDKSSSLLVPFIGCKVKMVAVILLSVRHKGRLVKCDRATKSVRIRISLRLATKTGGPK